MIFSPLTVLCLVLCSTSVVARNCTNGYHVDIGIPKAQWLMLYEKSTSRIVGGTEVNDVTKYPHQVGLIVTLTSGWTSICGGSLISRTGVLTAAHCWWDGESQGRKFTVVLGSLKLFSGGERQDVTDVTVHPGWNPSDIKYDIAIAKIKAVNFKNNIQAVPLPTIADQNQNFAGVTATASGYGKISDVQTNFPTTTTLYHTTISIITNAECQKSFKDVTLHSSHLCTSGQGKVGTCDGDSGGPLVTVWKNSRTLVGVVSFGLSSGCQSSMPSVYTRVTAFLTWIQDNM